MRGVAAKSGMTPETSCFASADALTLGKSRLSRLMLLRSPGVFLVRNLGQHPPKHIVPIPEMMLQRSRYVQWNCSNENNDEHMMDVFRHIHHEPEHRKGQVVTRNRRHGHTTGTARGQEKVSKYVKIKK